ncbi:AAA family ATPase [Brevibacillus borstelensis]|jgi:wobble nucleotide-excising tRNase|uniref:AAA family ATPase n=1 Tax=Brevibacillus borstelensis TaxID=45462 RepID=UPI000A857882|nr:AAA family ATPase [Brevibacillus borstelensis]WNF05925.1 AAA family ATPase [Brevibacillus borstelensis]
MSNEVISMDTSLKALANQLIELNKNVILIFAFNGTGKTRLSVEYKNITKQNNEGNHSGVYYNAYSEDLFVWDNDPENEGGVIKLDVISSSLNQFHSSLDENKLREKLSIYKPKFEFKFIFHDDFSKGIKSVCFFSNKEDKDTATEYIKISRGEEQIFIWCFFLTLFDIQGWTGQLNSHFFIDDPVSSLDDHNIFITASTLMELIDEHFKKRKIIITTHHVGFFSILADWLTKGEKASAYKNHIQMYTLKNTVNDLEFLSCKKDVFLYHLELLQLLQHAINEKKLYAYHFAILRQVLENISSFLGVGRISYVLEQIGISDTDEIARIVNTLSHKTVFRYEAKEMVPDNEELFLDVFSKLQNKYNFIFHVGEKND